MRCMTDHKKRRHLVDVLLNEVNLTFLSKYNGPTGSIFISVPLLNFQNFVFCWITRPVVFRRSFQECFSHIVRWNGDYEELCAKKTRLGSEGIPPPATL